jgi:hypothetical protein
MIDRTRPKILVFGEIYIDLDPNVNGAAAFAVLQKARICPC